MPTSTDLVTDLPADFETFGQAVDTSLAELKGGTSGQVLSKASNTDMDFTWVTSDDANAIQNTIVDAKGDLIAASASDVPARLAVGNNGETLVADSSTSTGLSYQANWAAGKNKIINGDFGIWQRGTTFNAITSGSYFADRFGIIFDGTGTRNITRQSFTSGAAPVSGYESQYFLRVDQTVAGSGATFNAMYQLIENVQTFAGQTVTLSFWAKASSSITLPKIEVNQSFGSGGSAPVQTSFVTSQAITTSWTRYTMSIVVPSITGKTVGTSSSLGVRFFLPINSTFTLDIWGVQLEAGSTATAFQTATGTIQGELAACQRYYYRQTGDNLYANFGFGTTSSATIGRIFVIPPVTMRVKPSSVDFSTVALYDGGSRFTASAVTINTDFNGATQAAIDVTASGMTASRPTFIQGNGSASAFLGFSAEL
jgi:hypothetical protein